jgi:dethiobiotin synthetase
MALKIFVTGTDTNVGKTIVSVGLLKAFNRLGLSTLGLKPLASGCFYQQDQLFNEDALNLISASSLKLKYTDINPFAFLPPVAPHLAAKQVNISLTAEGILEKLDPALSSAVDVSIIEGVGGWHVPLNQHETMAEVVKKAKWPVIVVIAIRLGCLNHALLTIDAIVQAGLPIVGWVANCMNPEEKEMEGMIHTLINWLPYPLLGRIPYQAAAEEYLDVHFMLVGIKKVNLGKK